MKFLLNLASWCVIISLFGCRLKNETSLVLQKTNPSIRVLIMDSAHEVIFSPSTSFSIKIPDGTEIAMLEKNMEGTISNREGMIEIVSSQGAHRGAALRLESLQPAAIFGIRTEKNNKSRLYEGMLDIFPSENGMLEIILALPMEEYLKGVVPYEIGSDSPLEAMCAQAVAARSEAYVALVTRKYAGNHYDICSDVQCQVFRGNERRTTNSDEAIRITRGHVLLFEGEPISAYYASNCGGHSEDIRNVWEDRSLESAYWDATGFDGNESAALDLSLEEDLRKWLNSSPSVYCNPENSEIPKWTHKNFRWKREEKAEDITKWVAEKQDIGRVVAIKPLKRGVSGRLSELEFVGEKGSFVIGPELKIRRVFKPGMRSAAFVVDPQGSTERPDRFLFQGAGSGHGVGMCQTGAIGMANAGKTFREILKHYYPKAEIRALY